MISFFLLKKSLKTKNSKRNTKEPRTNKIKLKKTMLYKNKSMVQKINKHSRKNMESRIPILSCLILLIVKK